jgi:hypothetical protein
VALWTSSDGQAANKLARSSSDLPGPRKLETGTTGNPGEDRPSRNTGENRKFGNSRRESPGATLGLDTGLSLVWSSVVWWPGTVTSPRAKRSATYRPPVTPGRGAVSMTITPKNWRQIGS